MTVRVTHTIGYRFDRPVRLGPQTVRMRPRGRGVANRSATMSVLPTRQRPVRWLRDSLGNWVAHLTFLRPVEMFSVTVGFVVTGHGDPISVVPEDVAAVSDDIGVKIARVMRFDSRVQAPEETLAAGTGMCGDMAWLLVHLLRERGHEARFVSGYLVKQEGAGGDWGELHAWAEVNVPGVGWVGVDPACGPVGPGHVAVAVGDHYGDATQISGVVVAPEVQVEFFSETKVERIRACRR